MAPPRVNPPRLLAAGVYDKDPALQPVNTPKHSGGTARPPPQRRDCTPKGRGLTSAAAPVGRPAAGGIRRTELGQIRELPDGVVERIAAGEVVERPASIVRELIDNALDAGATRVDVELGDGGRALIAVADDGHGMDGEDARLAFARHATSKLRSAAELDAVATLGFRGEALAAIASVARVELVSRRKQDKDATRVVLDHGREVIDELGARAPGTTVSVTQLFAGVPARRKFMKSAPTELDHCTRAVHRAALARPDVAFRARHADRDLLTIAVTDDVGARVAEILGSRWGRSLLEIHDAVGEYGIAAWIGRSDLHRPTSAAVQLFVNRRPVRDGFLIRAVADAFRHRVPAGRYPIAVVYLELPRGEVDVNVHPAKSEVRFHRPREIRALVVGALSRALAGTDAVPSLASMSPTRAGAGPAGSGAVREGIRTGFGRAGAPPFGELSGSSAQGRARSPEPAPGRTDHGPDEAGFERSIEALAQYNDCFIVARDADGLLIVDQHVAHERLLFERLVEQTGRGALARQALLFPTPVELDPRESELLSRHAQEVERIGYAWEPFGPNTVSVREVPAILGERASADSLTRVLEALAEDERSGPEALFRRLLATVACHSAVRKGMRLTREKMDYILQGLVSCEIPTHCPHGRVISLRVDLGPLEREFGRG